jgi:hypothetical protein
MGKPQEMKFWSLSKIKIPNTACAEPCDNITVSIRVSLAGSVM